jgi:hypothetical protein
LKANAKGSVPPRPLLSSTSASSDIFQLLKLYREHGSAGLQGHKPGPKHNYVRTDEVVRQVIRHRFLDPDATVDVIAQKLRQAGFPVSTRSVVRIIEEYGLQKKTLSLPTQS